MNQFDEFPSGKRRKEIIKDNKLKTAELKEEGKDGIRDRYNWLDSPLDEDTSFNLVQDRPFSRSFSSEILPDRRKIKDYICTTLEARKGKAIGIEFGGIGIKLFSSFPSNFFAKSVGVTLVDHRDEFIKKINESREEDIKLNHQVLEGDIFETETYESLNKILGNKKVDLIMERMGGGLNFVPIEPYTVSKILQIWYSLLREGGIMFVQTPVSFNCLLEKWAEKIQTEFKNLIDIQYQLGVNDSSGSCSAIRLYKFPGAPEKLPLLDPRTVKKIKKES